MGFLDRLLGKKQPAPADDGIYFYVRCDFCRRVLHTRLDPQRELTASEGGYQARKEMMDDRCFRRIYLDVTFDSRHKATNVEVEGGTLIDRETWEHEKDLPRRPTPPAESTQDL